MKLSLKVNGCCKTSLGLSLKEKPPVNISEEGSLL